jgi:AcrR family transcriptional regulator
VADAAGVSQGALQYHFATKADLVDAALSEELVNTLAEILTQTPASTDEHEGALALVDQIWAFHQMPIFAAVFELLALARRDSAAARKTARTLDVVLDQISAAAAELLPHLSAAPNFPVRLGAVVSGVRGAAAISAIPSARVAEVDWAQLRVVFAATLTQGAQR